MTRTFLHIATRRNRFHVVWRVCIAVLLVLLPVPAHSFRVAVFIPTTEGNTYWPEVHAVMRAAATSLHLEITFYEFDVRDRFGRAGEGE